METMFEMLRERYQKANLNNIKGPFSVAFTVTNKCNYRCRHCYNNSGENRYQEMTDEELLDIASQICELSPVSVCLCGGEPLIRGNVIYDIINMLSKECGIVNIVSNGYLIDDDTLSKLKSAGTNTIQISLDGNTAFLHENMRMIPNAFEIAVKAIKKSVQYGFKVAVSFCPNAINIDSFEDTCHLVKELGVAEIRTMPLVLMGRGKNMRNLRPSADQYLLFQQKIAVLKNTMTSPVFNISHGDPIDHLYRMPSNSTNGMNTYAAEIRSDGKIVLSTYLPIVLGDLKKHTLKEYWESGYKDIWGKKEILDLIKDIYSTSQFGLFIPEPYTGVDLNVPIIND